MLDAGWKYQFFDLDDALHIDLKQPINLNNFGAIILVNYFGLIELNEDIRYIRNIAPHLIIIEDDVQAFYDLDNMNADYAFTSLRKWFPCPDGGVVRKTGGAVDKITEGKSLWSQYKLAGNLLKSYAQYIHDSISLALLDKGEELLDHEYLSECSEASKTIFSNLNFDEIALKRKANAKILHEGLEKLGINHLYNENSVPLFIPIFIDNRDELRKMFFNNNIFTPKHWPKVNGELNGTSPLYDTELSLICDQRYDEEDMIRQIEVLKKYMDCR